MANIAAHPFSRSFLEFYIFKLDITPKSESGPFGLNIFAGFLRLKTLRLAPINLSNYSGFPNLNALSYLEQTTVSTLYFLGLLDERALVHSETSSKWG